MHSVFVPAFPRFSPVSAYAVRLVRASEFKALLKGVILLALPEDYAMRFRIEYLTETTEQHSVCQARSVRARDLSLVTMQAHAWSARAREKHGAGGFQIRDLGAEGRIVVIETFEGPVERVH